MGCLYWSVSPLPSSDELSTLRDTLERAFPAKGNHEYLEALVGGRALPRAVSARFGALSLLPGLLTLGGIDPATVILRRDLWGRPYGVSLTEGSIPFDFNLSHSGGHALCALLTGGGRVGADVEEAIPSRRALPLIRRYCTDGELQLLESLSEEEKASAFTRIWTVREALGKQEGHGMPLRYDATVIPDGIRVVTGRIAETNTRLSLCFPGNAVSGKLLQAPPCLPVTWEDVEMHFQ